jgi:hypothetical protein
LEAVFAGLAGASYFLLLVYFLGVALLFWIFADDLSSLV